MGLITESLSGLGLGLTAQHVNPPPLPGHSVLGGPGGPHGRFESMARQGYGNNEIVFSAVELLASSAGEPHIIGKRMRRERATVRNEIKRLNRHGIRGADQTAHLIRNKFIEELPEHPAVKLVNAPNPFMSRGQLWGTVVMDRALAGNAYLVKARGARLNNVAELWRLRPDRVEIIPSRNSYIEAYEYKAGPNEKVRFDPSDIIHFKTRNPLNEYYGQPPLMAAAGRVDIDNYMRGFLRTFFERGGTGPGSILSVKQRLTQEDKDSIRDRFKRQFGAAGGFHELMVLDQAESTFTQMGLNRGLRDALPKEIDALQEARIAMVFGIPGSILGLLIGYESSSYANKRADWQVFWDVTMSPLLSDLDDVLNLSLVPDYTGIDELAFDLDDIKALQEDVDAIRDRDRKDFQAGGISLEEFRDGMGRDPEPAGLFFVPAAGKLTPAEELGETPEPVAPPMIAPPSPNGDTPAPAEGDAPAVAAIVAEPTCPKCGRRNGANINAGGELKCLRCSNIFVVS